MTNWVPLVLVLVLQSCWIACSLQMGARHKQYRHQKGKHSSRLIVRMSEQSDLLEQMRRSLGESEDIFEDADKESKMVMKGLRDLDRDPNMKINKAFMEWLGSEGVWIKQESAWGRAPHPLVISSATEDDGESCGRGLLSRESMSEGELMMTIPLDLCLTRAVAQETFGQEVITDNMDEYIAISLLLMTEKLVATFVTSVT